MCSSSRVAVAVEAPTVKRRAVPVVVAELSLPQVSWWLPEQLSELAPESAGWDITVRMETAAEILFSEA
jgi:hypothetical protein